MVSELKLSRRRGGNRHPIAVKEFIVNHLRKVGQDYISGMHGAYVDALDQIAIQRRREFFYHHPTYHSFRMKVWELISEGVIEFSGKSEESTARDPQHFKGKIAKRYYHLVKH